METKEFTQKLDGILFPYLGRLDYGNLRKAENWPHLSSKKYVYHLAYESNPLFHSTGVLTLLLDEKDMTLNLEYLDHHYSIKTGINRFLSLIKAIPNFRIHNAKEGLKIAQRSNIISFEDQLNKTCKELNLSEFDLFTLSELKKLRNHFSKQY